MTQSVIVGSDIVSVALKTRANANFTELYLSKTELEAGRDGEATLLAKMQALDLAIGALVAGSVAYTVSHKAADDTLSASELVGTYIFTNTGAGAAVNLSLPAGVAGYRATFVVTVAQYLKVTASGVQTFRHKENQTAAGGYIQSATIGHVWTISWNGTEWIVENLVGTLSHASGNFIDSVISNAFRNQLFGG